MLLLVPGLLLFRLHACRYLGQEKTVGAASLDNEKSASEEKWTWDTTGDDPTWQIKLHDGEFCMQAGRKNGSPVVAAKCDDIPFQEGYAFSKQQ